MRNRLLTRKSAVRHLIMLGMTLIFAAGGWLLCLRYDGGPSPITALCNQVRGLPLLEAVSVFTVASAAASAAIYWGSVRILPALARRTWRAFVHAVFSLPILHLFTPRAVIAQKEEKSLQHQLEYERIQADRQLKTGYTLGVAAVSAMSGSHNEDFIWDLLTKPVVFCFFLALLLGLHLGYLVLGGAILAGQLWLLQESPILGACICGAGVVLVFLIEVVQPLLSLRRANSQ